MLFQKKYWEKKRKRRSPDHPVVKACCRSILSSFFDVVDSSFNGSNQKATLLDLGSGNGYFSYQLRANYDTVVLDYSSYMLKINPFEKKVRADIGNLPFPDKSFDVVLCANSLHHVENMERCLIEMKRVSRDYIILIEPNGSCPFILLQSILIPAERAARKFTTNFIQRKVEEAGLKVISYTSTGIILPKRFPVWSLKLCKYLKSEFKWALFNVFITRQ